ncbi:hypothetical protein KC19_VG031500 [Ceratodon purpureus]|uniref:Uncharacterized protein n=1 Tax=Ceratodon purpureus TaxID=3225 RepID=A0A8T0HLG5_CERPU|nr:hypothetical protein KC19_VG031500 [Ceratodon purpureus]
MRQKTLLLGGATAADCQVGACVAERDGGLMSHKERSRRCHGKARGAVFLSNLTPNPAVNHTLKITAEHKFLPRDIFPAAATPLRRGVKGRTGIFFPSQETQPNNIVFPPSPNKPLKVQFRN